MYFINYITRFVQFRAFRLSPPGQNFSYSHRTHTEINTRTSRGGQLITRVFKIQFFMECQTRIQPKLHNFDKSSYHLEQTGRDEEYATNHRQIHRSHRITEKVCQGNLAGITRNTVQYLEKDQIQLVQFPPKLYEICSNKVHWKAWRIRFTMASNMCRCIILRAVRGAISVLKE